MVSRAPVQTALQPQKIYRKWLVGLLANWHLFSSSPSISEGKKERKVIRLFERRERIWTSLEKKPSPKNEPEMQWGLLIINPLELEEDRKQNSKPTNQPDQDGAHQERDLQEEREDLGTYSPPR